MTPSDPILLRRTSVEILAVCAGRLEELRSDDATIVGVALTLRVVAEQLRDYDELCDVALGLANALRPFSAAADYSCTCPDDGHYTCPWHVAKTTLKSYENQGRGDSAP